MPNGSVNQTEISRLARDHIRFRWLSLHAREIEVSPVNCASVQLKYRDVVYSGDDLDQCVDKVIEANEPSGTLPVTFADIHRRC